MTVRTVTVGGQELMLLRCCACRSSDWPPLGDPTQVAHSLGWRVEPFPPGPPELTCPDCWESPPLRMPRPDARLRPVARHAAP